ncbi:MAG: DUF952 domain-containing protein [Clostridiales bacterium]|nr:DUF952 domain-containing protein [Clostridiales bacterium]
MIYHITTYDEYEIACKKGSYETMTLQTEGFTHCSYLTQVIAIANEFFSSKKKLCLLYDLGEKYPHIYGPLNLDAIVMVKPLEEENGTFNLPII